MIDLQNISENGSLFLSIYKLYDIDKKSLIYSDYVVSDGIITLSSLLNHHPLNINDIETIVQDTDSTAGRGVGSRLCRDSGKLVEFDKQNDNMIIIIALIFILLIYLLFM
jgi:hypothetical protein